MHIAARSTDPITSHEAAHHMATSGKQAFQQGVTLAAVQKWPGLTSLELAGASNQCRFMLARRLPEAEELNLVYRGPARKCDVSGRKAATWYAVKPGQQMVLVA